MNSQIHIELLTVMQEEVEWVCLVALLCGGNVYLHSLPQRGQIDPGAPDS